MKFPAYPFYQKGGNSERRNVFGPGSETKIFFLAENGLVVVMSKRLRAKKRQGNISRFLFPITIFPYFLTLALI